MYIHHKHCRILSFPSTSEVYLLMGTCRPEMKQKPPIPIEDAKGQTGVKVNLHSEVANNINLDLFIVK